MCGGSYIARGPGSGARRSGDKGGFYSAGPDGKERSRASSLAVVAAVALSGVFLVVFVPELWWVFTTYFWVAFPALGRLSGAGGGAAGDPERELLAALRRRGEISPGMAAAETSLSVAEADRRLGELAGAGHLEVRARGGAIFYALWEAEPALRGAAGEDGS